MRILISCWGTVGEVLPFVWFSRALAAEGHAVHVCGPERFRDGFADTSTSYTVLMPDLDTHVAGRAALARMFSPSVGWETLVAEMIDPFVDENLATVATCIGTHGIEAAFASWITPAVALAGERSGIPVCRCYLYPAALFQAADPPVFPRWLKTATSRSFLGSDIAALRQAVYRHFSSLSPNTNRAAAALGYAEEERGLFPLRRRPGRHLAFFPARLLQSPEPDVLHLANTWSRRPGRLPPDVADFLDDGPPPVVVSLGSRVALARHGVFDHALRACLDCGERAIGIVGAIGSDGKRPVPNVLLEEGTPPSTLAPRAKAVIHHGGIGTTQETLAAGKPTLCLPQGLDQPDNAVRLERLGVGAWLRPPAHTCPEITAKLGPLLGDDALAERARRWADERYFEEGLSAAQAVAACFGDGDDGRA